MRVWVVGGGSEEILDDMGVRLAFSKRDKRDNAKTKDASKL